jgi:hypothetical protein
MTTGENNTTWGTVTNTNLGTAIEEAITGSADVAFSNADITLTLTNTNTTQTARNLRLNLFGTATAGYNLIVPAVEKAYIVANLTDGTITVKNATGTGIAVPTGKTMWVFNTGSDVVNVVTYLSSLTLGTALSPASGGTGANSLTSGYLVKGNGTSAVSASLVYDSGTNVGIGTSSPVYKLDVSGGSFRVQAAGSGAASTIEAGSSSTSGYFASYNPAGTRVGYTGYFDGTVFQAASTDATTPIIFATNSTERFRIGSLGQWGLSGANYGTSGQVLTSQGTSGAPIWASTGAVTSVSGTGSVSGLTLTGTVTTSGSLTLGGSITSVASAATIDGVTIGYRNIPRSTTSGTATTGDIGKCIAVSAGITIPNSTFSAGDAISIYNDSAAAITITAGVATLHLAGTSSTGNRTLAARGVATIWFNSATEAIISGAGVS